jgi:hypothetical protein
MKSTGNRSHLRTRPIGRRAHEARAVRVVSRLFRPRPGRYRVVVVRAAISWEHPKPVHVLLLVPLVVLGAWIWQRGKAMSPDRGAVLAALRAARGPALPEAASVGALTRTETARYDRDSLYEAIDGAADGYLARGFVSALMATYTYAGAAEISAELHRFGSEAGAGEQRAGEKPSAARSVPGFEGAESDGTVLLAVRGRDYLKLTSLTPGPEAEGRLVALARAAFQEKTR